MIARWLGMLGLLLVVGAGAWLAAPDTGQSQQQRREGNTPAEFSLPDLAGKLHSLPKGEVVLLNFWATWCPPCRQELPSMVKLYEKFGGKLKVVAISVDHDAEALASFVREHNLPFTVLHDADSEVSRAYGVFRYPESFIINRKGQIVSHEIGAINWMDVATVQGFESLMTETAAVQVAAEENHPE